MVMVHPVTCTGTSREARQGSEDLGAILITSWMLSEAFRVAFGDRSGALFWIE